MSGSYLKYNKINDLKVTGKAYKFDIIIPTYNRAAFIEKAINSVKNQIYTEWNLYILDNASTDNTNDFIKGLLSDKIHYRRNDTNIGLVRNWMKGLTDVGEAQFAVLLSDDDELGDDFLLKANEAINRHPDLGIYSSAVYVKRGADTIVWMTEYINPANKDYEVCLPGENLHFFLGSNPVSPAAMLVNRESLKSISELNFSCTSAWTFDRFWWAQIALFNKAVFCCTPTAIYYQHDLSVSTNIGKNNFDQHAQAFRATGSIVNIAYSFGILTVERLEAEIKKLKGNEQVDVLCGLVLFGHKVLQDFAIQYFNQNSSLFLKKGEFLKKFIYKILGVKLLAFVRMYKSRT